MSNFFWNRIHKWEENLEAEITDGVYEYVLDFYQVDDVEELNEEQLEEIKQFRDESLNEYSPIQWGFNNLINMVETAIYEREEN